MTVPFAPHQVLFSSNSIIENAQQNTNDYKFHSAVLQETFAIPALDEPCDYFPHYAQSPDRNQDHSFDASPNGHDELDFLFCSKDSLALQVANERKIMQQPEEEDMLKTKSKKYTRKNKKAKQQVKATPSPLVNDQQQVNAQVFLSHLVRSANKEKTELVTIQRGALYLSTPHVHKLVVRIPVHVFEKEYATIASMNKSLFSLVLYRRLFRGETLQGKEKTLEFEGKLWRPVNFSQGLKGEPIKHAIHIKKEYPQQIISGEYVEYSFDVQFLVNSFNTSRELEYANFILQVKCDASVIYNSEPFRLRARNDYVEQKRRRLVFEEDEEAVDSEKEDEPLLIERESSKKAKQAK